VREGGVEEGPGLDVRFRTLGGVEGGDDKVWESAGGGQGGTYAKARKMTGSLASDIV
jgi:hypothetical protein